MGNRKTGFIKKELIIRQTKNSVECGLRSVKHAWQTFLMGLIQFSNKDTLFFSDLTIGEERARKHIHWNDF